MSQRTTIFRPPTPGGDELLLACLWPWNSLRDKTSSAYLAQVFSKFRWPGNLSVFYGTQFGKCYQKQIPRRTCEPYSWAWIKTDCEFSLAAEDNVASHIPLSGWQEAPGDRRSASIHEWWKTLPQGSSTVFSISFNTKGVARPSLKNADMNLMWSDLMLLLHSPSLLKETVLRALDSGSPGSATHISVTMAKLCRFSPSASFVAETRNSSPAKRLARVKPVGCFTQCSRSQYAVEIVLHPHFSARGNDEDIWINLLINQRDNIFSLNWDFGWYIFIDFILKVWCPPYWIEDVRNTWGPQDCHHLLILLTPESSSFLLAHVLIMICCFYNKINRT